MYPKHFLLLLTCTKLIQMQTVDKNWWKNAVFYQIYPRSFKDSNGDGTGDLQGIISKLDHLVDIGVTAVWLSPIYTSPQIDQGYDISDFRGIDPTYGTMTDFENLVSQAHAKNIKVIMDFVPNHSSDQHNWFIESAKNTENGIYNDYYVWKSPGANGAPNNWISVFKNSAWKLHTGRNEYYLHQFAEAQPDLNYRSEAVRTEMKEVLKFWLGKGVDGFRMDAVPFLYENKDFLDEPRSNLPNVPNYMPEYLRHIYTQDQPETFDMIYEFRKVLEEYSTSGEYRVMMTEAYTDITNTMYYYGNEGQDGAHFTFNFFLITDLKENVNAAAIVSAVEKWLKNQPVKYTPNWVLGNHDNHRVATRLGPKNVDNYNILIALLPGIMVTYNGEEIGQENGAVTFAQGKDPNACSAGAENFAKITRDVARTPFHWDNTKNAGFSDGDSPWLPVSSKYLETNLKAQQNISIPSHYHIYKQLIKLRQLDALKNGNLVIRAVTDDVLVFSRTSSANGTYLAILNFSEKTTTISINIQLFAASQYLEVVVASITSARKAGDLISTTNLKLQENEGLVVKSTNRIPTTTSPSTASTGSSSNSGSSSTEATTPNGAGALTAQLSLSIIILLFILSMAHL